MDRDDRFTAVESRLEKIEASVHAIHVDLARYRGALGMLMLIGTAIWAVVQLGWGWFAARNQH